MFAACSLATKDSSVPLGKTHSSLSRANRPLCGAEKRVMVETFETASASNCGGGTPSASASACAALKMIELKMACRCSLLKLIRSCSSELDSKSSKPKMSSSPTNGPAPLPPPPSPPPSEPATCGESLMAATSRSKSRLYSAYRDNTRTLRAVPRARAPTR